MRWRGSCVVMFLVACGPAVDVGEGDGTDSSNDDSSSAATSNSTSAGVSVTVSTTEVPPDPSTTGPFTTTATVTTEATTTMTVTSDASDTTTGGTAQNGASCEESSECMSGHCYIEGILGGICGECEVDADCAGGGCSAPNPIAIPPLASVCNDGGYGAGCMSSDVCQDGLECATVIDVPGVLIASTCSECAADAECDPGFLCAPDIAIVDFTGVYRCVAAGSLANGQSCEYAGSGDESCVSGHCAIADVMGLLQLGVCSECEIDDHCQPGQVCEPPQVDLMNGLIAGSCG